MKVLIAAVIFEITPLSTLVTSYLNLLRKDPIQISTDDGHGHLSNQNLTAFCPITYYFSVATSAQDSTYQIEISRSSKHTKIVVVGDIVGQKVMTISPIRAN